MAAGTVMAADLSLRLGWIDQDLFDRVLRILTAAKLPVVPPEVGPAFEASRACSHSISPLRCQAAYPCPLLDGNPCSAVPSRQPCYGTCALGER